LEGGGDASDDDWHLKDEKLLRLAFDHFIKELLRDLEEKVWSASLKKEKTSAARQSGPMETRA
jgi:hypothetical protein